MMVSIRLHAYFHSTVKPKEGTRSSAITAIFSLLKFFHHELLHQRHRKRTFIERRIVEALEVKLCPHSFLVTIAEINPLMKADEISHQLAGAELRSQQFALRFRLR